MKIGSHQTPFQGHPRGVTFINFFISCLTSTYTTFPTVTNEAVLISQYPSVEKDTGDHGVVLMTRVRRGVSSLSGSCDTVDTTVTHYLTITHYLSYILGTDDSLCVCVCVCVCVYYVLTTRGQTFGNSDDLYVCWTCECTRTYCIRVSFVVLVYHGLFVCLSRFHLFKSIGLCHCVVWDTVRGHVIGLHSGFHLFLIY